MNLAKFIAYTQWEFSLAQQHGELFATPANKEPDVMVGKESLFFVSIMFCLTFVLCEVREEKTVLRSLYSHLSG
jgi:hypothetical protein